ncbi:hypothetical protein DL96DRAFT_1712581 [Flagelloscypha sp. PMI_526]|nr:hypothetical protein DL96DRAFT_1712581 [Flagelloscypha sp. PMI_526]
MPNQAGTLCKSNSYTTTRGVGDKSNKFIIIEKYASPEAFEAHKATELFKSLMAKGPEAVESISLEFNEAF